MSENAEISPKSNTYLLGHKIAEELFLQAWKNGKLHNSILICGERGIGKVTFAYKIARFLLTADINAKDSYNNIDVSDKNQISQQISDGACYNLKVIERDYVEEDKRKIIKAIKDGEPLPDEDLSNLRRSSFIKVDEVRTINEFLLKTSYDNNWKIVIIDSVDDMNSNAANALLKILEEPPVGSMLILISHNPNSLLATIKSRCSKIDLHPLQTNAVASLLRRYRSELSEAEVKKIAAMSEGSIGRALEYADYSVLSYYDMLCKIVFAGSNFKLGDLLTFADMATASETGYTLAQDVIMKVLSENIQSGINVEKLTDIWQQALKVFDETERLNMDKRQAIINIVNKICRNIK